jgi:hypothetical protein
MLEGKPLRAALEEITAAAYHGILFRCVSLRSLLGLVTDPAGHVVITRPNPHFLFDRGPVRDGGRFTPIGGEPSLYMAETENTARLEKRQGAAFRTVRQEGHGIEVAYALEATLKNVLDLTAWMSQSGSKHRGTKLSKHGGFDLTTGRRRLIS